MKKEIKNELPIRIDGAHRFLAATKTGFENKPLYCLSLQTHRRNLFPFNKDSARSIVESMLNKGYDKTQVIHLNDICEITAKGE